FIQFEQSFWSGGAWGIIHADSGGFHRDVKPLIRPAPFYPYQDPWVHGAAGGPGSVAQMWDEPGGGGDLFGFYKTIHQEFKTYAVAVKGPDKGKVYGRINWGHDFYFNSYWNPAGSTVTRWIEGKSVSGWTKDSSGAVNVSYP